ncbi:hypothetical protein [Brevibacillus choshinensis]|uniref:Uncharacterized protein n=1 Tax=Brevibacillus choshinensis TaxID=54911 RepID=A0ABX7FNM8_BRECH|nr:hypothetical protein [Brevibacillus choshinensis]QRG67831.1 hypothetical protein JNE38_00905 [Brevibacillus choshinensis]
MSTVNYHFVFNASLAIAFGYHNPHKPKILSPSSLLPAKFWVIFFCCRICTMEDNCSILSKRILDRTQKWYTFPETRMAVDGHGAASCKGDDADGHARHALLLPESISHSA